MSESTVAGVVAVLRESIGARLKPIEFDLTIDDETGEIQLITDAWTIGIEDVLEQPSAWLAIDAEPEHPNEFANALRDAFRPHELEALRTADSALNGLLTQALRASNDPLSTFFANILTAQHS
jgi:hypothetical protein